MTKILKATSGRLFGRVTSGTGRAEELTPSDVRTLIAFDESVDDRVSALLAAGTNISITYNDASNTLTIASTAGGLSGTGSVDNAALRADGTGGSTLQNSSWIINDNLTASPNNTVNHACLEATGGTTNVSVSIKPKGTGAFCLSAPDGTSTGGNVRGANSVDLQTTRSAANQVASGDGSFLSGRRSRASGVSSFCFGDDSVASAQYSIAIGCFDNATGYAAMCIGINGVASGSQSACMSWGSAGSSATGADSCAMGDLALADRTDLFAYANGAFAASGDAQKVRIVLRNKTTSATPVTLFSNGASTRLTIPSGKILFADLLISGVKSDGSAAACYKRKVAIKNVGGTTTLVGSVETIGTDIEDNASTDVAITADDTNDALQINVTGITSETWRWVAVVEGLEIAYGT